MRTHYKETVRHYVAPEISTTDKGVQIPNDNFPSVLNAVEVQISMDGKGS